MFKNILIPTDGSELSDKAVKHGVALARAFGAKLVGLHVMPDPVALYTTEVAWADDRILERMREAAVADGKKYLDAFQAAADAGGVKFERVLRQDDQVWKGIIDTAKEKDCDLILMAAHGRRGVAALLIGSETNKVLTHSRIPVLVYR